MKIRINQNNYDICLVNSNDTNLDVGDGDFRSGIADFRQKKIYIANDLCEDSYRYTLIHELTHAIMDSYGFLQVEWTDEIVADFMAIYVYEICGILQKLDRISRKQKQWENIKKNIFDNDRLD